MGVDTVPRLRGRFGRPYRFVDRCASTQRLLDDAPEGAVAVADEQTEGRGRLGRTWTAPAGTSLLFSIVLVPAVSADRLPELSLVAGAAVAEAIARETGLRATVKHPNDVLVGGRKVAGILAEAVEGRVVLGVGVNVSQTKAQLPEAADPPATSLALEGASVERATLLATILERLEAHYDRWISSADR
jgi:BirA family biotin operon repressor/biotin-[acetyl-CoA-carboxylase] ligase